MTVYHVAHEIRIDGVWLSADHVEIRAIKPAALTEADAYQRWSSHFAAIDAQWSQLDEEVEYRIAIYKVRGTTETLVDELELPLEQLRRQQLLFEPVLGDSFADAEEGWEPDPIGALFESSPESPQEALVGALVLGLTAPTDDACTRATGLAEQFAVYLTDDQIEEAKARALSVADQYWASKR